MTSRTGATENNEISNQNSNRQVRGGSAKETQPVGESTPGDKHESPSLQKTQQHERLALLGTSAVVFAHEVGNSLQAILGTLEIIDNEFKRRQIIDFFLTSMIQGARREVDRLCELLRECRSFTKAQDLDLQLADLPKIIKEVLALQALGHRAAGVTVKLECMSPLPLIMLDASKITQVILNLCKNAVEAMPDGGCLSIRMYHADPMIVIEIADSGVGIAGDLDVFQLFKTSKSGGSGLGLPIVQQIVSAHQGSIHYVTELGRGTTFTVELPVESRN